MLSGPGLLMFVLPFQLNALPKPSCLLDSPAYLDVLRLVSIAPLQAGPSPTLGCLVFGFFLFGDALPSRQVPAPFPGTEFPLSTPSSRAVPLQGHLMLTGAPPPLLVSSR